MRCKKCGGMLAVVGGLLHSLTEYYKCRHCKMVWALGPVEADHIPTTHATSKVYNA